MKSQNRIVKVETLKLKCYSRKSETKIESSITLTERIPH